MTGTTKTATTRHTNDCIRQRAKFGARSKAGDVCSCGGIDEQPPEHDAGLRDEDAPPVHYCRCGWDESVPLNRRVLVPCWDEDCACLVIDAQDDKLNDAQSDTGQSRRGAEVSGDLPVIASHTALLDVLDAAKLLIAMNNCNYDRAVMRSEGGFQKLEEAIGRVEQLRQTESKEYPTTYSESVQRAFRDWNESRAYIDNGGNYRVRPEAATPTHRPNGKIAPWNKEVKRLFPSCAEFHAAAQASEERKGAINANEAALTMTLPEYRLWWYARAGVTPPDDDERLSVRQVTDERLIREGYQYRRRATSDRNEEK